ncbi:hypothetical protein O9H85_24625 [Paenibacillus filicis]|uniref:Uncharacterized protein n=1 Tax=Paenibacillus gyeongsangnamensis TaxID=3388067 RepID=A0ABT4QFE4_9BACL|nr:hypothetical protein [Paenibacillus filicis]MCZ8515533.1 hypothetical protein [Paenibacillus filicis]
MPQVRHINRTDSSGRIYCCLRNKVVVLDKEHRSLFCAGCRMYAGDAGGLGVECLWEDVRPVGNPHLVDDPEAELRSNQTKKIPTKPAPPGLGAP